MKLYRVLLAASAVVVLGTVTVAHGEGFESETTRRVSVVDDANLVGASNAVAPERLGIGPMLTPAEMQDPEVLEERGMELDGLRKAMKSSHCRGLYEAPVPGVGVACSHGPDPGPRGVDVQHDVPPFEIPGTAAYAAAQNPQPIGCMGDGRSGKRVQAIYAVSSDVPDRYEEMKTQIAGFAAGVDAVFNDSAAKTGGSRRVRWVTNPDCTLNVAHVVMSPTGDDNWYTTLGELQAQGYVQNDRKYLIWADATVYCGLGQLLPDDSPGAGNSSNVGYSYARVDRYCYGYAEAHELVHMLGAVQASAPKAMSGHCYDEYDTMCYFTGSRPMEYLCPADQERLLDCNNDTYFHTNPQPGSYLDTHWNVARSGFLDAAGVTPPTTTTPPTTAPPTTLPPTTQPPTTQPPTTQPPTTRPPTTLPPTTRPPTTLPPTTQPPTTQPPTTRPPTTLPPTTQPPTTRPPTTLPPTTTPPARTTHSFGGHLFTWRPTAVYWLATGAGTLDVTLSGIPGRTYTVIITAPNGDQVARRSGTSGLRFSVQVNAGTYTVSVTGPSTSPFTVRLDHPVA